MSMCNRSTLSNTHYLPSGYLSLDRNITSSSGTTTASWTTELPCELDASQQVSRLHAHLYALLLHTRVMSRSNLALSDINRLQRWTSATADASSRLRTNSSVVARWESYVLKRTRSEG